VLYEQIIVPSSLGESKNIFAINVVTSAGKCIPVTAFLFSLHDTIYFLFPRTVLYLF
jgi:hypothetical protein